jgi:hypothetical protein
MGAARVLSRASPYLTTDAVRQQDEERSSAAMAVRHTRMELDVLFHICSYINRRLERARRKKGPWEARIRLIMLWFQTSLSTHLPRGGRNGYNLQPGEGKTRASESFCDMLLTLEDWLSSYVYTPAQFLLHKGNHYLNAVKRGVAAEVPRAAWSALVTQYDDAHPHQQRTPPQVTAQMWLELVEVHNAQRMRTELKTAGLFYGAEVGGTLRNSIRQKRKGRSRKGPGTETYFRDKAQAAEEAAGRRGRHQFHLTVTAPCLKQDFEHGIPFLFTEAEGAQPATVTVGPVGTRLVVSSYTGGLDELPEEQRALATGDQLVQIAGEPIATWTSTQVKVKLRGASYPLTYTFVRDLRSSKYKEFMKKKSTAAAAAKASKLGTLTHFRTGAAASKLAQATNKRKARVEGAASDDDERQQGLAVRKLKFGSKAVV